MTIHLPSYILGVATAPAWIYLFRAPIARALGPILASPDLDQTFYDFMLARTTFQDAKKDQE